MTKKVILVGDQFSTFANGDTVVTLRHFNTIQTTQNNADLEVIVGQGLSHNTVDQLRHHDGITVPDETSPLKLTHKHHQDNVMISKPIKFGKSKYQLDLLLNNANDRLLDHVTGTHVSGMVLIEAGRQASIACSELEYRLAESEVPFGFVWNDLQVEFMRFTLPVPTKLLLTLTETANKKDDRKRSIAAKVEFLQSKNPTCSVNLTFEIWPSKIIKQIEAHTGNRLIKLITQMNVEENAV